MRKKGVCLEAIESNWKGVQDVIWGDKGIKGISLGSGDSQNLAVWFTYLGDKEEEQREEELKLPKIFKNPSIGRESQPSNKSKIQNLSSKDIVENPRLVDRNKDL